MFIIVILEHASSSPSKEKTKIFDMVRNFSSVNTVQLYDTFENGEVI